MVGNDGNGRGGNGNGRAGNTHFALAAATGLVAFLLVTAWSAQHIQSPSAAARREQLAALVAARQRRTADLERQLADLRRALDREAIARGNGMLQTLGREIDAASLAAGTEPVNGPGLVVELSDSPDAKRTGGGSADFQIQDVDVQLVVNALWDAGAEAVAVNDQRVVGTTAIRSAGGAILVNYRVLTSPYRIEAIGPPDQLDLAFMRSAIAKRFRTWADVYHLGLSVRTARRLHASAFSGSVLFRYAEPVAH